MKKSQKRFLCSVCAIFFCAVYGVKLEKHIEKVSEIRKRNDWQLCDFRKRDGCVWIIADEKWQHYQEGEESFLLAGFKPGESSFLSFASLVKPPLSNHVCLILKHFRSVTMSPPTVDVSRQYIPKEDDEDTSADEDNNLPKIYIGIEPEFTLPFIVEEVGGSANEWKTDYFQISVKVSFRFFVNVQNIGTSDAKVALQYLEIRDGNCNSAREGASTSSKYIREKEHVEDKDSDVNITKDSISGLKIHERNEDNFSNFAFGENVNEEPAEQEGKVSKSKKMKYERVKRGSSPFGSIVNDHEMFGTDLKKDHLRHKKEVKGKESVPSNYTNNVQSKKSSNLDKESGFANTTEEKNKSSENQNVSSKVNSNEMFNKLEITTSDSVSDKFLESNNNATSSESKSKKVINEDSKFSESTADNWKEIRNIAASYSKSRKSSTELAATDELTEEKNVTFSGSEYNGASEEATTDTYLTVAAFDEEKSPYENNRSKWKKSSTERTSNNGGKTFKKKEKLNQSMPFSTNAKGEVSREAGYSGKEKTINNSSFYMNKNTEYDTVDDEDSALNEDAIEYENTEDFGTKVVGSFRGRNSHSEAENSSNEEDGYEEIESSTEEDNFKEENFYNERENSTEKEIPTQKYNTDEIAISTKDNMENAHFKETQDNKDDSSKAENVSYINTKNKLLLILHTQRQYPSGNEDFSDHSNIRTKNRDSLRQLESLEKAEEYSLEESREENNSEEVASEDEEHSNKMFYADENVAREKFSDGSPKRDSSEAKIFSFTDIKLFESNDYNDGKVILKPIHRPEGNSDEISFDSSTDIDQNSDTHYVDDQTSDMEEEPENFALPKSPFVNDFIPNDNSQNYGKKFDTNLQLQPDEQNHNDYYLSKFISGNNFLKNKIGKLTSRININSGKNEFSPSNMDLSHEDILTDSLYQPQFPIRKNNFEGSRQLSRSMDEGQTFYPPTSWNTHPYKEDVTQQQMISQYNPGNLGMPFNRHSSADDSDTIVKRSWPPNSGDSSYSSNERKEEENCGGGRNIHNTNQNKNSLKPSQVAKDKNLEHQIVKFQVLPPKLGKKQSRLRHRKWQEDGQIGVEDEVESSENGSEYKLEREEQGEEDLADQDSEEESEETLDYSVEPSILKIFNDFHEYIKNHQNKKTPISKRGYTNDVYAVLNPRH